jgi:hypothetical protein
MPELKHNFIKGRMNKDLDERLVPNGEYRDALNIEVVNSEGSDMGSAQTTMGNVLRSAGVPNGTCVASIANEKEDKIYWMIAHPPEQDFFPITAVNIPPQNRNRIVTTDIIAEYDFNTETTNPVLIDTYSIAIPTFNGFDTAPSANILDPIITDHIRIGMIVTGYDSGGEPIFSSQVDDINSNNQPILEDDINIIFPSLSWITFTSERVLNFDRERLITGINIISASDESEAEGILFWTDNHSEPKRVNIEHTKLGSSDWETHTLLMVRNTVYGPASTTSPYVPSIPIEERHVTVIKQGPPAPPVLLMRSTKEDEVVEAEIDGSTNPFIDPQTLELNTDNPIPIQFTSTPQPDFEKDDHLIISCEDDPSTTIFEEDKKIRVIVYSIDTNTNPPTYELLVLSGDPTIRPDFTNFNVELEQGDPLFQFKFPRFAYRYKYEDGEYSPFSPFTQVAFLPDDFYYLPKEGYNLGMVNQLRYLAIKDFVHPRLLPEDVVSIDILYKESNSPNIYSVKTIKRKEFNASIWDEWNATSDSATRPDNVRGFLKITSELIHRTLPSNQLLRPWDNVPRKALAQEISGNRLIYGNYLQNYNLSNNITNEKDIIPKLNLTVHSANIADDSLKPAQRDAVLNQQYSPRKSVKSLRTYQIGVVYIDEYGRETPVFSNDTTGSLNQGNDSSSSSSIYIEKLKANQSNALRVKLTNTVPDWAKAFKYFVKETSNEYYNLALDRWYDAEDGNVWLSFPSSERNKVDIDTFLILKKEHDADVFVTEPARYKILAIENEAPTFIKTDPVSLGIFTDDANGDLIGPGGIGWPLPELREIWLEKNAFDNLGWDQTILGSDDLNQMWLRIKGTTLRSDWYQLASVGAAPQGGNNYIVKTKKRFGEDMSLTSANGDYTSRYGGLEIEIVNRKISHKAEFDGRFFVKILKDQSFINRIIKPIVGENQYIARYSKKVQYINPVSPHNTNTGSVEDWYGFGYDSDKISHSNHSSKPWRWTPSGGGSGQDYWSWAGISKETDHNSSGWFIDSAHAFRRFRSEWEMREPNSDTQNRTKQYYTNPGSRSANRNRVTNDTGTTYKDPDQKPLAMRVGIANNSSTLTSAPGSQGNTQGMQFPPKPHSPSTWAFMPDLMDFPNTEGGEIVPSTGIDVVNDMIHLSFAGFGDSHSTSPTNFANLKLELQDWGNDYAADLIFANEISTPGTLWRWKEDPDHKDNGGDEDMIYQTISNTNVIPGTVQSPGVFAANVNDYWGSERGVALYNYIGFEDYLARPHHKVTGSILGIPYSFDICYWSSTGIKNNSVNCSPTGCALGGVNIHGNYGSDNAFGYESNYYTGNFPMVVDDWNKGPAKRRRYQFVAKTLKTDQNGNRMKLGSGPHGYLPTNDPNLDSHFDANGLTITDYPTGHPAAGTAIATSAPGIRFDGMYSGLSATSAVNNGAEIPSKKTWNTDTGVASNLDQSRAPGSVTWQILEPFTEDEETFSSRQPAIFETEPKEDVGLDIYHEVGQIYPVEITEKTIEQFVGPVHTDLVLNSYVKCYRPSQQNFISMEAPSPDPDLRKNIRVASIEQDTTRIAIQSLDLYSPLDPGGTPPAIGDTLVFTRSNGGETEAAIIDIDGSWIELAPDVHNNMVRLPWHNCYSFGNGVESDRVRDDYNQVTIDNGPKASTTLEEPYLEERRCSGLIHSGIYNSLSGVNNLNQFIQAEKITKDLNPTYGCVQKLHSRNTDLITLCEDKVLTVLANKDALFNADGSTNLTSSSNVLGQVMPASRAEYGISKNPESFASQANRMYFVDRSRGAVLRFSQNGLQAISSTGMKDYFSDNLPNANRIIGSFDDRKGSYNITFNNTTVSYTESAKGWTSFKSFVQENGLSLNSSYYTFNDGNLWEHHVNPIRNTFYGNSFDSSIKFLFNEVPGSVKSFNTLNYEGSQARTTLNLNDPDYYNNIAKDGWYVDLIETNLQTGNNLEFKDKEGKWFSTIKGETTTLQNLDTQEFSVQGIGNAEIISCPQCPTSWVCEETTIEVSDCQSLTRVGFPFGVQGLTDIDTIDDFIQFLSDPANNHTGTHISQVYACLRDQSVLYLYYNQGYSTTWTPGICYCHGAGSGQYGVLTKGYALGFELQNVYTISVSQYTTWDNFLSTIINDWSTWSQLSCPVTPGMTYHQLLSALSTWGQQPNAEGRPRINIGEHTPCNCTPQKQCDCVEVIGSHGAPTKIDCENDTSNCCGSGPGPGPTNCCDDPLADNYDPNCNSTCPDITIGDYNQLWIDNGSVVWDATTSYNKGFTNFYGYNVPTTLVKHNNEIYFARYNSPIGIEPGNEPSIPSNGFGNFTKWIKASEWWNQGSIIRKSCCQYDGCKDLPGNRLDIIGGGYINNDNQTCLPIVYGCMDCGPNNQGTQSAVSWYENNQNRPPNYTNISNINSNYPKSAENYYQGADVDDGTCIYITYECDGNGNCSSTPVIWDGTQNNGNYYATLADCQSNCSTSSCPPYLIQNVDYFITQTNDTGSAQNNNCDASINFSASIPNFTTGDSWDAEVQDSSQNVVYSDMGNNVSTGGWWAGNGVFCAGTYTINVTHNMANGNTCSWQIGVFIQTVN